MATISAANWTVDPKDDGMPGNVNKIQGIIDNNASSGDTIVFTGSSYGHLYLVINKPLNLVSNVGTKLSSCPSAENQNKPIFNITSGGIGTNITGFNITSSSANGVGILINNAHNIKIENTHITSGGYGIKVDNSNGVIIKSSSMKNSGISLSLFSSNNTKILGNNITNNAEGIIFDGNTSYSEINGNNISNNQGNGIAFLGSTSIFHRNVIISYNYINNQGKSGIYINSSFPNMNILSNMLTNNGQHGILIDYGSDENENSMIIEYNYIMNNRGYSDFEVQRKETPSDEDRLVLNMGYNFFGTSLLGLVSKCAKTSTGLIVTEITKVSNGLYKLSYLRQKERTLVKEMIPHYVNVYLNDQYINVFVNGGTGLIDFREHKFKSSGNQITITYKYTDSIQIKDNELPVKSIAISTSTNQNKIKNGEAVQYTTIVKNNGDKKIQNIQISKLIPSFSVYSFTVSKGSFNKNTGIWTIPIISAGETATLKITFKANKANTYKTSSILTGDGFNLKSNQITLKVVNYVNISSSNKIQSSKVKKNKATYLSSTIKNTGTKASNYISVKIKLPKGVKITGKNYKNKFNKKTNTWKIKIPSKKAVQLKMKVKGTKKGNFKIFFNVNGKKQTKYLRVY